jgi:hypothetical protein
MARKRTPKLPIATVSGESSLHEGAIKWETVERAYGNQLSPELREEIFRLTQSFVQFAPFELSAEPVAASRARIQKLREGAMNFGMLLDFSDTSDARIQADWLVHRNLTTKFVQDRDLFGTLKVSLRDFISACNQALVEIEKPGFDGNRDGEYWEKWICALTRSLDQAGLPTSVSNDQRSPTSPFTSLVYELQNCVPKHLQRHCFSEEALAKAIQRLRKGQRRGT